MSDAHYLPRFTAILVGLLLIAWLYAVVLPIAFLPSGYPSWAAKSEMLRTCQIGQIAFFGDSRTEAGVIPAQLPVESSNLGVAAGTAIETASAVRRALACPTPPRQAIIALTAEHFGPLGQFFWNGTLRYGFLPLLELWDAKRLAATLGDTESFNDSKNPAEFPDGLRDWMYGIRFPTIYFSSFVQGRLFGRYAANQELLTASLQRRGYFPHEAGENGREPAYADFRPVPLQTALFEQTLRDLVARGVAVGLLIMPVSPQGQPTAALEEHHRLYLQSVAERIPGVQLIATHMPHWPQRMFSDDFHMTSAGAAVMTARLAACLSGGVIRADCDLDWHEPAVTDARPAIP